MKQRTLKIIIVICSLLGLFSLILFYVNFQYYDLSIETSDWGAFGAYISGIIGTMFSFISVVLIYFTLRSQTENFHLQQFESTFFNMLSIQREIVKNLYGYIYDHWGDNHGKNVYPDGNEYINIVSKQLEREINDKNEKVQGEHDYGDEIQKAFGYLYKGKEAVLGHYFRHLYHIFKFTHESRIKDKRKYIDIIQAQMSDNELYITFYNGICKDGRNKFKPLLDHYQFFENIKSRNKLFDIHKKLFYPNTDFKYDYKE